MDVLFRYIDKEGQVFNQFLDIVAVSDGKADTIITAAPSGPSPQSFSVGTCFFFLQDIFYSSYNGVSFANTDSHNVQELIKNLSFFIYVSE